MASILIIDDDKSLCQTLCRLFRHMTHDATGVTIKEACRISGLSRSRLYHLLNKYKINR